MESRISKEDFSQGDMIERTIYMSKLYDTSNTNQYKDLFNNIFDSNIDDLVKRNS